MSIVAVIVLAVISYVSGVTMRYFADFAWLIVLPAIFVLWQILDDEEGRALRGFISLLVLASIPLYSWTFLGTTRFGALVGPSPWIFNIAEELLRFL